MISDQEFMSNQQLNIVLLTFLFIMIAQYFIFYLRGMKIKIPFFILTVLIILGAFMEIVETNSVIYSIYTLAILVWAGMLILGVYKFMTYRVAFVRVLQLANKAPTNENVNKLTKHIKNRRVTLQWVISKNEKYVDVLIDIYNRFIKSNSFDSEVLARFEETLTLNGFEYLMKKNEIYD